MSANIFPALLGSVADTLPPYGWGVVLLICLGGLALIGLGDVSRFSLYRTRAIAGVCFRESIRRRVLWLIPLTILGAVVCCQLQRASDEEDVVRQTTKFCLFATGLVVTMAAIILACTNLPREIDNRVIFTIVTKPATRLELIVGKIAGFACLTGVILLIMGVFTYGYVSFRNYRMESQIAARLESETTLTDIGRQTLEHYQAAGMMTSLEYARPSSLEILARVPAGTNKTRSVFGGSDQEIALKFAVDMGTLFKDSAGNANSDAGIGATGMLVGVKMKWQRLAAEPATLPTALSRPSSATANTPSVSIDVLDSSQYALISSKVIQDAQQSHEKNAHSDTIRLAAQNEVPRGIDPATVSGIVEAAPVYVYIPPNQAKVLFTQTDFFIHIVPESANFEYFADESSAFVAVAPPFAPAMFAPEVINGTIPGMTNPMGVELQADGSPVPANYTGRLTLRNGQSLRGADPQSSGKAPLARFPFRAVNVGDGRSDKSVTMALHVEVNREGSDAPTDRDDPTQLAISFQDPTAGTISAPLYLKAENGLTSFLNVPAKDLGNHDFNVIVRCETPGHYLGLTTDSVSIVSNHEPFVWNLFKSLLITWMMTVLVVAIAIFSSTFLSWPIAVVLTIVIFMGHWAVSQVADVSDKSLGRSIATDMGLTDASASEMVATSVNKLSSTLKTFNLVLPDTDRFAAIEDIDKGVIISSSKLGDAVGVLTAFGLPLTVLGYIFLKKKEVAP